MSTTQWSDKRVGAGAIPTMAPQPTGLTQWAQPKEISESTSVPHVKTISSVVSVDLAELEALKAENAALKAAAMAKKSHHSPLEKATRRGRPRKTETDQK